MPVKNYGVLKGQVVGYTPPDDKDSTPHFTVNISDNNNHEYEIIINVKSKKSPSELLYYAGKNFHSEQITNLPNLNYGFTNITNNNREIALDYIRGNLLDRCKLVPLPVTAPGDDNDLQDKFLNYMKTSENNPKVDIYAYGEKIPPGIHDVHMNQGNVGSFRKDDGIWQDGGVLFHYKDANKWEAVFLAFQSQSWCTDDSGHAIKPVENCNYKSDC
ncbi:MULTISPECIES: YukJ family protein [Bacillus]|uniref:YukJ family protein n=2 Tax=Bacillaceae TaxID=186817 RepID=UPI000BEF3009|nr:MULTISPECIES: YukJ family protein [Bacillus]MBJ8067907.1 YukJ family protein [Bacillus cereus group sp. N15]MCS3599295.1 uncharacterized protein YukJ [Bacillus sp. JUb91]PEJ04363.1 hypothetical protein CN671_08245 [Bacillus toyonensis]TBX46392.1 DUF2278 family protein [Bacillus toyonensis]HDR7448968.1 YukJ family protein [Bacillus toyonensis]